MHGFVAANDCELQWMTCVRAALSAASRTSTDQVLIHRLAAQRAVSVRCKKNIRISTDIFTVQLGPADVVM